MQKEVYKNYTKSISEKITIKTAPTAERETMACNFTPGNINPYS